MSAQHHPNHERIDDLIRAASDPIVKAVLMLLSRHETTMSDMVRELTDNTHATRQIAQTLHDHVSKEEVFQTKIEWSFIAGRVVGSLFFVGLATLAGYIWSKHISETDDLRAQMRAIAQQVTINTQRLNHLESDHK